MNLAEMLEELRKKALADPKLRKRLLETRKEKKSPAECFFLQRFAGNWDIPSMRWILSRREKNSTHPCAGVPMGGGENSPMLEGEDDFYELFFASISFENSGLDRGKGEALQ